jgi:RNA polymerase sigma-70 factor (ECF subfamily)
MGYLKARYGREFKEAFQTILEHLTIKQRNVLRMYLLEGMTTESIGQLYQVHAATAWRWITAARQMLISETRRLLAEKLKISATEMESLMGILRSQLDISIGFFLRRDPSATKNDRGGPRN